MRWMHRCGFLKACSQMRTTRHPCLRSVRLTSRSRALLAAIFFDQKTRLLTGRFECLGQPCQKQPSTKTATFCFGKTKSGLPKNGRWRRHPVMLCWRKILMRASSVSLLPCPRIRDMTSERLALVKTSDIGASGGNNRQFQSAFGFLRGMSFHTVIQTGPLRVTWVEFIVG